MTAYVPNLPALVSALPGDSTRAPQTEFTRARQVDFLENLSITGSVRSAASAARVSHQTAYRARRGCAAFRTAWDAALVVARAAAADTLACRAIEGVEEKVFYHGEEVATRIRYDARLLLAHLARLDRLVADPRANAFAEDFDTSLERFGRGEAQPEPDAAAASAQVTSEGQDDPDFFAPGQCNTRSMSPDAEEPEPGTRCPDCGGRCGDPQARLTEDDCQWLGNRIERMEAARPATAAPPHRLACLSAEAGAVETLQLAAFEAGVERWWLVVPYDEDGTDADGLDEGGLDEDWREEEGGTPGGELDGIRWCYAAA